MLWGLVGWGPCGEQDDDGIFEGREGLVLCLFSPLFFPLNDAVVSFVCRPVSSHAAPP